MAVAVGKYINNIIHARDKWTRKLDIIEALTSYISLSKTSPEIFEKLFTAKGALVKTEDTVYWAAAVRVLGKNFSLKVKIHVPLAT